MNIKKDNNYKSLVFGIEGYSLVCDVSFLNYGLFSL